jgi:uncharacterized UBP type Zn finger protein
MKTRRSGSNNKMEFAFKQGVDKFENKIDKKYDNVFLGRKRGKENLNKNKISNKKYKDNSIPLVNLKNNVGNLNKRMVRAEEKLNIIEDKNIFNNSQEMFNDPFVDSLMFWRKETPPGSGLNNLGNTCFLNSVMQCILYTAPLKNYFDLTDHSQTCKIKGVCFICEYGKLAKMVGMNLY